ncbi:CPBP family intramembrane metalloprotease [Lentisphaerota bacterium ZTH]|nr:CPBP family intramembrane metalloprotease [Lentisphaerota bacterium]WET07185.1 CPBP family intramembrane metalloprotease [Lentisphaerota bacterium ZTH]
MTPPLVPQFGVYPAIFAYIMLLAAGIFLWTKRDIVTIIFFAVSVAAAFSAGIITLTGITAVVLLGGLCFAGFKKIDRENNFFLHLLVKGLIAGLGFMMIFHLYPGFHNLQLLNKVQISEDAVPYSLFLNYDSMCVAIIIMFFNENLRLKADRGTLMAVRAGLLFGLLGVIVMGGTGLAMHFFKFDFKISSLTLLFLFCNLLFTCFFEETFWRGYVQNTIADYVKIDFVAVLITALVFGVIHIPFGGINFAVLAALAGLIYGYAYLRYRRLESCIVCHYTVNVTHFIFATYPILASAYKV